MTQTELADRVGQLARAEGLPPSTVASFWGSISKIESDRVKPRVRTARLLAKALGMSFRDLVGGDEGVLHDPAHRRARVA